MAKLGGWKSHSKTAANMKDQGKNLAKEIKIEDLVS